MKILGRSDLRDSLKFALDHDGQTDGVRLTLTILDVYQIMGEGCLHPAKSEAREARRIKRPARKSSGDALGSWDLGQGPYWLTYNESVQLPEGTTLVLQPHEALLKNGLWHPTLVIRDWADVNGVLLVVSARGVKIMEGSPISTGYIFE